MGKQLEEKAAISQLKDFGIFTEEEAQNYQRYYKNVDTISKFIKILSVILAIASLGTMISGFATKPTIGYEYGIDSDGDGKSNSQYITTTDDYGNQSSGFDTNLDGKIDIAFVRDDAGKFEGFDLDSDGVADVFIPTYGEDQKITRIDVDGSGNNFIDLSRTEDGKIQNIEFNDGSSIDIIYKDGGIFIDTDRDGFGDVQLVFNDGVFIGFDKAINGEFDGKLDAVSLYDLGIPHNHDNSYSSRYSDEFENKDVRGGVIIDPVGPGDGGGDAGGIGGNSGGGGDPGDPGDPVDPGDLHGNDTKYSVVIKETKENIPGNSQAITSIGIATAANIFIAGRGAPGKKGVFEKGGLLDKCTVFFSIITPLTAFGFLIASVASISAAGIAVPSIVVAALVISSVTLLLSAIQVGLILSNKSEINSICDKVWEECESVIKNNEHLLGLSNGGAEEEEKENRKEELKTNFKICLTKAINTNEEIDFGNNHILENIFKEIKNNKNNKSVPLGNFTEASSLPLSGRSVPAQQRM